MRIFVSLVAIAICIVFSGAAYLGYRVCEMNEKDAPICSKWRIQINPLNKFRPMNVCIEWATP